MTTTVTPDTGAATRVPAPDERRFREAQLEIFRSSVLKQAKWAALSGAAGDVRDRDALDLGTDNGVISFLFRERGGRWTSADLTDETVEAISRMTGERAVRLHDARLPFPDRSFDLVVMADLLEHVEDDRLLLAEVRRVLRPGGRAVLNLPHAKPFAILPPVRHALGLTDAWHGHLRPGYTRRSLARLLPPGLALVEARTYSRFFSHLLDTALNFVHLRKTKGRGSATAKGTVITGHSLDAGGASMLRKAYPVMKAFAGLDALLPFTRGYMLLATVERLPESTRS